MPTAGSCSCCVSIGRALQLVDAAGPRGYPKPTVGAVVVRDGEIVGEGVTEAGRPARRGRRARRGGRARARSDALRDARAVRAPRHDAAVHGRDPRRRGRARRLRRPRPESGGRGRARRSSAAAGVDVEFVDWFEARVQNEAWRTWVSRAAAVRDLQGGDDARRPRDRARPALGDRRGEPPPRARAARRGGRGRRRRGHAARRSAAARRARRRDAEGPAEAARLQRAGRCRDGLELELRTGRSRTSCAALAAEGVQSLLLEGGPTLAAAFLAEDLVDKVLALRRPDPVGRRPVGLAALPSAAHAVAPDLDCRSATTCSSKRMSTTPDASQRADDEIVTHLSHWLTRQLGNDELRRKLEEIGTDELPPARPRDGQGARDRAARPPSRASAASSRCSSARRSRRSSTATNASSSAVTSGR